MCLIEAWHVFLINDWRIDAPYMALHYEGNMEMPIYRF